MNIKAIKSLPGRCERRTKNAERRTGDRSSSFSGLVSGIPASPRLRRASRHPALALRSARAKEGLSSVVRLQSAFTLIELLITIVLVGIVLLALVMSFHESLKSLERQQDLQSANLLCEDLMNEIRSKQYANPQYSTNFGREAGETNRIRFNDVDDYDNWSETPPKTVEGSNLPNCTGFTRSVIVVNVPATNFNSPALPDSYTNDFKRITVVVRNTSLAVSNISVVSRDY